MLAKEGEITLYNLLFSLFIHFCPHFYSVEYPSSYFYHSFHLVCLTLVTIFHSAYIFVLVLAKNFTVTILSQEICIVNGRQRNFYQKFRSTWYGKKRNKVHYKHKPLKIVHIYRTSRLFVVYSQTIPLTTRK